MITVLNLVQLFCYYKIVKSGISLGAGNIEEILENYVATGVSL